MFQRKSKGFLGDWLTITSVNFHLYCYVIQSSLQAKFDALILISLYVLCLGVLHYDSLYALNLHSTFARHWVPFSLGVSQNKKLALLEVMNSNSSYI